MSLTDRIERLAALQEALQLTADTAVSAGQVVEPVGELDRATLVKIDSGLRRLRQGG